MARRKTGEMDSMDGGGAEGDRLQEAASGLADQAARTADAQASTTMTKAGETLDQVAQAIREAGNGLREQQPQFAGIADTAAHRVEDASSYLREHDAREVVDNVQSWAREQPAMVIGGGLALGLLLGRFLKSGSSGQAGGSQIGGGQYPSGYRASGQYGVASSTGYGTGGSGYTGYETSSAGYAGGTGYAGAGSGAVGVMDTGSTLSARSGLSEVDQFGTAGRDTSDDLAQELLGTDTDVIETDETIAEEGVTDATTSRRRR
jgi:ElaB/YqjD/DUF883 family membrane-anchored ribosome-binding protein